GRAVDAVAAGARAHVNHGIAHARGLGVENVLLAAHAEGEDVDQRVAVVAGLENAFAANSGHAETVAIVRDARYHAAGDAAVARARFGIVQAAEAQRIHDGDGARAHGKDIAQNAAHPGGRPLK